MNLLLIRDIDQPATYCTLGTLQINGRKFHTIERPWLPNPAGAGGTPQTSCIPIGTYRLEPRETEARGKHWILCNRALGIYAQPQDIPASQSWGRSLVLIHAANWAHELLGCIAPGKTRFLENGEWMVKYSRDAMNELRTLLGNQIDLSLTIQIGGAT